MGIVYLIIIGAAAGLIASRVLNVRMGLLQTIAVGVLGAVIGGFALRMLLGMMGMLGGLVGAVLGAILVLWLWQRFFIRRR